jgi:ATP-binding cassette subfamily C protein
VVVITQKPALLSVVDKIMVLANGAVALFGSRERVLQQLNGPPQTRGKVAEGGPSDVHAGSAVAAPPPSDGSDGSGKKKDE